MKPNSTEFSDLKSIEPFIHKGLCFECEWHTQTYNNKGSVQSKCATHTQETDHKTCVDQIPVLYQYYESD